MENRDTRKRPRTHSKRRRRKRSREILGEIAAGAVLTGMFIALMAMYLFGDDGGTVTASERRYYMPNSDYYYTNYEDYEKAMAERQAYLDAEAEEAEAEAELIRAAQEAQAQAQEAAEATLIASRDWGAEDAYLLAKIAMAEAEGEDTEGKALVMLVVLNRVWSDGFPGTVEGVIYEEGQFTPIYDGRFDAVEPDADCWAALDLISHGWDESQGALYFESTPEEGESTWHSRNLKMLFIHGGHTFYTEWE